MLVLVLLAVAGLFREKSIDVGAESSPDTN
jgi:hypothetical protein